MINDNIICQSNYEILLNLSVGTDPVWDRIMENCRGVSYAEDEVTAMARLANEDILARFESAEFLEFKKRQHFLTKWANIVHYTY